MYQEVSATQVAQADNVCNNEVLGRKRVYNSMR